MELTLDLFGFGLLNWYLRWFPVKCQTWKKLNLIYCS